MSKDVRSGLSVQSWASASLLLIAVAFLSKGLGFFRELLIAKYFGVSGEVDAFIVALTVALLAGSGIGVALSTMLIPVVHTLHAKEGEERAARFVGKIIVATLVISAFAMVPLIVAPESIIRMLAPSLSRRVVSLATSFVPWLALYALLLNLVFVLSAAFNTHGHFSIPAFSDLGFNVVAITILLMFASVLGVGALVAGSILGLAVCGGILFVLLWRHHLARFGRQQSEEAIWPFLYLCMPILLLEFSCQVLATVENYFASGLAEGSIAALNYARRVNIVLVALVALNVSRGVFPTFSALWREGKRQEAGEILTRISNTVIILFIPTAVCCVALRDQILALLYMRGAFDHHGLEMTEAVFIFYCGGLVAAVLEPVFIKACYAFRDTWTPLVSMALSAVLATIGSYLLIPVYGLIGIAFVVNLAVAFRAFIMAFVLSRALEYFDLRKLGACSAGALICAGLAYAASIGIPRDTPFGLLAWSLVFAVTYLLGGWFFLEGSIRPLVWRFARFGTEMRSR
ncbi:MAG: hypothetical protein GDA65_06015 [Nitrospira sp. CR1.1]|nr:hypothetical protein [Nitrospira sp. CR1.1]